jgi:hypothetical protein
LKTTIMMMNCLLLSIGTAQACSFCAATAATRNTLGEEFERAKAVVAGVLKNPNATASTTEFQIADRLKADPAIQNLQQFTIPKYYPLVGNTPPDYLLFLNIRDNAPDVVYGVPHTAAVTKYLTAISKLDVKDRPARLAFCFQHLDSTDPTVSDDAFLEFAKASDREITAAKVSLDPKRVQKWLTDPKTPPERLGVYAMLLGLCGNKEQIATFIELIKKPQSEVVRANLGGILAGYTLLDPKGGWDLLGGVLSGQHSFEEKFATLGTVRYFQSTTPKESRDAILKNYRTLLADTDFADIAIEDLRRWNWWDLTDEIITTFAQPVAKGASVKKSIVRYTLTCPTETAKTFVASLRKSDPALVSKVEESLKLIK